jgi:fatty acid desaturase
MAIEPAKFAHSAKLDKLGQQPRRPSRQVAGWEKQSGIQPFRKLSEFRSIRALAEDYFVMIMACTVAIGADSLRRSIGMHWAFAVPFFAMAIIANGGIQHRLASLGHEASHYTFLKNRLANDLVADLFCMFPLFTSVSIYRLFHMAHHQFVNDPEKDPDIINLGRSKKLHLFPLTRTQFIREALLRPLLSPITFQQYQFDYFYINVLGKGGNVYMKNNPKGDGYSKWPRLATVLGMALIAFEAVVIRQMNVNGMTAQIPLFLGGCLAVAAIGAALLPDWAVYQSPFKEPYNSRVAGWLRIAFVSGLMLTVASLNTVTADRARIYFLLLWIVPIGTTFPYFMMLRDMYQHSNADDGRITNTRVFHTDWLTDWAVFVHGQDQHTPHHLYPSVPFYQLEPLHNWLKENDAEYARDVIEVYGTFANGNGKPTIVDELTRRAS